MASREDDFLSRWSRRKVDSRDGLRRKDPASEPKPSPAEKSVAPAPGKPTEEPEPVATVSVEPDRPIAGPAPVDKHAPVVAVNDTPAARKDDPDALSEEELAEFADVDFDKLNYASDYERFMEKSVPDIIRRRALRALWSSNPILANIDGLNDYDEDFTDAALAIEIVGSNYKPGTGYLTEEERQASYGDTDEQPAEENQVDDVGEDDDLDDGEDSGVEIAQADDESSAQEDIETDVSPESNEKT